MKQGIHPEYVDCAISCACGHEIQTKATVPIIHVEICSHCHPYFTGKHKIVDTAGRVEKFQKKYKDQPQAVPKPKAKPKKKLVIKTLKTGKKPKAKAVPAKGALDKKAPKKPAAAIAKESAKSAPAS